MVDCGANDVAVIHLSGRSIENELTRRDESVREVDRGCLASNADENEEGENLSHSCLTFDEDRRGRLIYNIEIVGDK